MTKKFSTLQDQFGLRVDPTAFIWQLSVGEQQRVEILKTLYRGAKILILDEPTAVLAPQEIDDFMETMRSLVATGKSIIFISHKLHEVTAVADRVTVLRKGVVTAEGVSTEGMTKKSLAQLMVGRSVVFAVQKKPKNQATWFWPSKMYVPKTTKACLPCEAFPLMYVRAKFWVLPASLATAKANWPKSSPACVNVPAAFR